MSDAIAELVAAGTALDKFRIFRSIGYEPHARQAEIHESRAPVRVAVWGTRAGKSKCAAAEAFAESVQPSEHPKRGWVVAPTYDLCDKVLREIFYIARLYTPELILHDSEHERKLVLRNLGGSYTEVFGKTAENPASLMGEGLDWCVVDEAARLKPDIWSRYLMARLVDKRGWGLAISTPRGKGWYFDLFRDGQGRDPRVKSWQCPTSDNPYIDKQWLAEVLKRTPDIIKRQEFLAEFLEGAGAVFRNVRERATCELEPPKKGETYVAGLDLARTTDYTVLVVLDSKRRVVHVDRFHRIDWSVQIQRVAAATKRYNDAWTLVDSTGAGEPVYEALLEAGVQAGGYSFTNASKAALVNNLAMLLERGEITLPRPDLCPELVDETEAFEYSVTEGGTVRTSAPSGQHDDAVCALMLAAWAARQGGQFELYEVA